MTETKNQTKKQKEWKLKQDVSSWVGQKLRWNKKDLPAQLLKATDSETKKTLLLKHKWVKTCIAFDKDILEADPKHSGQKAKDAFKRLTSLRIGYGQDHTDMTVFRQNRRVKAVNEVKDRPKIKESKWREFLAFNPLFDTLRVVKDVTKVTVLDGSEIDLGPKKDWITTATKKNEDPEKIMNMEEDIKTYEAIHGKAVLDHVLDPIEIPEGDYKKEAEKLGLKITAQLAQKVKNGTLSENDAWKQTISDQLSVPMTEKEELEADKESNKEVGAKGQSNKKVKEAEKVA